MSPHSSPWLVRTPDPRRRLRLFCFAYAGGNAFSFLPWQGLLNPAVEVCALQLPGRGARLMEPPISNMQALLHVLAPAVAAESDLPFAFFGHSVGSLIAFELARYLRLHGLRQPLHLFMSGCQAPRYRSPSRQLHRMPEGELLDTLRSYNGTPSEVLENRELMTLLLPTIRADFAIAESYCYRHAPPLMMPISVYAGIHDDNKARGQVDGWKEETEAACEITWFDGGHFFINGQREPLLRRLDEELGQVLGRSCARVSAAAPIPRPAASVQVATDAQDGITHTEFVQ